MKNLMFCTMLFAAIVLGWSCENDDENSGSETLNSALLERFPNATDVTWQSRADYRVATFSSDQADHLAWFSIPGTWHMSESDINFSDLPVAVSAAFAATQYSSSPWRVEDVDRVERRDYETFYVIEVENDIDAQELDLYFSADGILLKSIIDSDDENDYEDYIDDLPSNIAAAIDEIHPGARILEVEKDDGMIEVEIIFEGRAWDVLLDRNLNWVESQCEMMITEVPATIIARLETMISGPYTVDDVDYYRTPERNYYVFEVDDNTGEHDVVVEEE